VLLLAGCSASSSGTAGRSVGTAATGGSTASGGGSGGPAGIGGLVTVIQSVGAGTGGPTGSSGGSGTTAVASELSGLPPVTATRSTPAGEILAFVTPSQNIGCQMDDTQVRCDIRDRTWPVPATPASCELDYGQGLYVNAKGSGLVCAGDTVFGPAGTPVLDYHQAAIVPGFACVSLQAGVTCRNASTGHGFTISRDAHTTF
jgi:hypothetical protein